MSAGAIVAFLAKQSDPRETEAKWSQAGKGAELGGEGKK